MHGLCKWVRRGQLANYTRLPIISCLRTKVNKCEANKIKLDMSKFKEMPCGRPQLMGDGKDQINETKITKPPSIWLNPFCDEDDFHCPFNPRFDDIYYIESDKAKRKYWQTWVSCPPVAIKKKKICCFKKTKAAPLRRRKHKKPQTACPHPPRCMNDENDCPRVRRRCHKKGRIPPSCVKLKRPLICRKPLTPYPAFSECCRRKASALQISECVCYRKPMLCEVWAEWRRRNMSNKK